LTDIEGPSKWEVVAALKKSGLPTSDRIIIMMLVDAADADTAIVPEKWTPSLTDLAEWTGLGRSTVATRLKELERLGWVKRARPATADALMRGARTCYHLAIGQAVEKVKPARTGGGRHGKPGSTAEPVQPLNQSTEASSTTGLVQPLNHPGSAVEPPLVQPLNRDGSAVEHKSPSTHQDPSDPSRATADAAAASPLPGFEDTEPAPPPKTSKRKAAKKTTDTGDGEPTENQRINTLAKVYTDVVSLTSFHAVRKVVAAAVKSGDYSDDQIRAALTRLADQRMSCSHNTLRIELEGPTRSTRGGHQPYRDPADQNVYLGGQIK
jgi:DNA-binding Lrp family transcriptional regulator